jgi:hypothetical protein
MMAAERPHASECVGPVLAAGPVADAIVAAIRRENDGVEVTDRGSYLRAARSRARRSNRR